MVRTEKDEIIKRSSQRSNVTLHFGVIDPKVLVYLKEINEAKQNNQGIMIVHFEEINLSPDHLEAFSEIIAAALK